MSNDSETSQFDCRLAIAISSLLCLEICIFTLGLPTCKDNITIAGIVSTTFLIQGLKEIGSGFLAVKLKKNSLQLMLWWVGDVMQVNTTTSYHFKLVNKLL